MGIQAGGQVVRHSCRWVGSRVDKPHYHSHVHNFSQIIFKHGKDIHGPKILFDSD